MMDLVLYWKLNTPGDVVSANLNWTWLQRNFPPWFLLKKMLIYDNEIQFLCLLLNLTKWNYGVNFKCGGVLYRVDYRSIKGGLPLNVVQFNNNFLCEKVVFATKVD